jgi:hypothetical protein
MPHKLTQLKLDRVDSCPAGSNPGAHIVLMKRKEDVSKATFEEIRDSRELGKMLNEVSQMTWDLYDAVTSSLWSDGDRAGEVRMSIDQYTAAVDKALESWAKGKPMAKEHLDAVRTQLITKFKEAAVPKTAPKKDEKKKEETAKAAPATLEEALAELKKRDEQIAELVAKGDGDDDGGEDDDEGGDEPDEAVMKSLPESVRKMIEKQNERLEKAEKAAKDAEQKAAVEKDAREQREFIEKARTDIPNLPGTAEEKGTLLKVVNAKLEKKDIDALMKLLKAGDTAVKSLVMMGENGEIGSEVEGDGSEESLRKSEGVRGELEDKAAEIRKVSPKLSAQQAFARACAQNPTLYKKMRQEQNKSRRVVAE